jgi:hypothetical protein
MFTFILRRRFIFLGTWRREMRAPLGSMPLFIIWGELQSARALPFPIACIFVREHMTIRSRIFLYCVLRLSLARRRGFAQTPSLGLEFQSKTKLRTCATVSPVLRSQMKSWWLIPPARTAHGKLPLQRRRASWSSHGTGNFRERRTGLWKISPGDTNGY